MTSRRERRTKKENNIKMKKGAKKQLVIMIVSIVLMIFSLTQTYYLTRYTLGFSVEEKHLKVYKWVCMLLE